MPICKLLYIIQVKGFSWPYLISKILVTYNYSYNAASDWPRTFFTAMLFLFSISLFFVSMMLVISKPDKKPVCIVSVNKPYIANVD